MRIKTLGIIIILVISSSVLTVNAGIINNEIINNDLVNKDLLDGGWIEERNGITILHISGSYYEMGFQQGHLLKYKIHEIFRFTFIEYTKAGYYDELTEMWNEIEEYIPQEIKEEFRGIADGANLSYEDLNIINLHPLLKYSQPRQCTGMAAWGPATSSNKLIQASSSDTALGLKDPVTGKHIFDNQVIVVRKPENGYASMYPALAGWYGWGGINTQSIGICIQVSLTDNITYKGIPIKYKAQLALDQSSTAEEAIDILTSNRTIGYNIIVSDGKVPEAYVVETNADTSYVGTYNDSVESTSPFWKIDYVLRRPNIYINKTLAATQRDRYNPKSLLLMLFGKNDFYPFWRLYKGISRETEKHWGDLNMQNMMSIFRDSYSGKTDLALFLAQHIRPIKKLLAETGFLQAIKQWVVCPETGDALFCFSKGTKCAYENPVHSFNMYELLDT